ncbi:uncharacterized protein LOC134185940 [Corticium candelabrum]|uniref:uncharacterized protein LOC134185940 n=1 Tax=Corticium candelabrum TaxID=121492 RepID=UPI002E25AF84|nr:uncharacterized protein LOC134185940 [Corticium candelabrum]
MSDRDDWQPGCVQPDGQSEFDRIPTWMWALVFVLVALLLLTYAGLLLWNMTKSTATRQTKRPPRVTVSRRSSSESGESPPGGMATYRVGQMFDCHTSSTSGTVNSHLVAVYPGFYRRDRACQTDDPVMTAGDNPRGTDASQGCGDHLRETGRHRGGQLSEEPSSFTSSLSIDTPGMTLSRSRRQRPQALTLSSDSFLTAGSDRDVLSHLTATGLYGKAGEPMENSFPRRIPNVPGFRIVEQLSSNASSLKRPKRPTPGTARVSSGQYAYSVTEEDGILFHEIHFPNGTIKQPARSAALNVPYSRVSESEGESAFTGASYSDVFGEAEPRTANVPDGASTNGEPQGRPLHSMFEWDYSSMFMPRYKSKNIREKGTNPSDGKVFEVEC